jgi:hypothetical protein
MKRLNLKNKANNALKPEFVEVVPADTVTDPNIVDIFFKGELVLDKIGTINKPEDDAS